MKTRIIGGVAILLSALVATGCASDSSGTSADSATLQVGVFGGNFQDSFNAAIVPAFQKESSAKIETQPTQPAALLSQLQAGQGTNPPYDVLALDASTILQAVKDNLLAPIETDKIAEWNNLAPNLIKPVTVNGKIYAFPLDTGRPVIAYRTDLVKTAPKSWWDLFENPDYKGRVSVLSLQAASGVEFFGSLVHAAGGDLSDSAAVNSVFERVQKGRDNVRTVSQNITDTATLLQNGDISVGVMTDASAAKLTLTDKNIAFVYPDEGGVPGTAYLVVPAGADLTNAFALLSVASKADVQTEFCAKVGYICSNINTKYTGPLADVLDTDPASLAGEPTIDYQVAADNLSSWSEKWTAIFQ